MRKIQHEAARIVSGATKLISIEKILDVIHFLPGEKNISLYHSTK